MEEKELQKVFAFDSLFSTNRLQMLKILLTYLSPSGQKSLAIYIKFMELQYTISFFNKHPHAALHELPKEETLNTSKLCDEILPFLNPTEQEKITQIKNMFQNFENLQEMMQMIQMLQEMFPEGMSTSGGPDGFAGNFDFLSGLSGIDPSQLSQMSDLFKNI